MHAEIVMLALVLGAALLGGRVAARFGYPTILGEIAVGILLGPPVIGLLESNEAISVLGEFGILLMMLYIGVHLDLTDLRRASVPGLLAASGGFLIPTGLGIGLMLLVGRTFLEALFVGLAMGVTSLATKSRILVDLKILDTRIAHVLVAGALLSDVAVLVVFAAVVGPGAADGVSLATAAMTGVQAIAFAFGAFLIGRYVLPMLRRLAGDRSIDRGAMLLGVIVFGLLFAWVAELAGIHAILGAFVAGLFIDKRVMDRRTSKDVQGKLATLSVGVLAPFFFVSAGFEVSLGVFQTDLPLLLAVIVLATLGKLVGTALFYLPSGNGWREGVVVGAGMNGRGAVEIIVAEIALVQGLIDRDVFSILVFMALFTTATVPVLLTIGVRWLRRRGELVRAGDRREAMIVGAGPIARRMGSVLQVVMPVTLIDTNRANHFAGEAEGLTVHPGNGLDESTLEAAGVDRVITFFAATPNAEVNVLAAQLAADHGVPDVYVWLSDSDSRTFGDRLPPGAVSIVPAPADIAGWEHSLTTGAAVVDTVPAGGNHHPDVYRHNGSKLIPLAIISNGERYPYSPEASLEEDDQIVVLRRSDIASEYSSEELAVVEG